MDEQTPRTPPHNSEAERSVIGSMLLDVTCVGYVIESIHAEDFYEARNRVIFDAFLKMFLSGETIDAVTVLNKLRQEGSFEKAGGTAYLNDIINQTPTAANVKNYVNILRDATLMRETEAAAQQILDKVRAGEGSAREIVEAAEKAIYEIRGARDVKGLSHIRSVLFSVMREIDALSKTNGQIPGVPTGIGALDSMISGLNNSDFVLLASRPGVGKTSFALNIAVAAAKKSRKSVAIFQLEMSKEQLALRLLSSEAQIDMKKLRTGDLRDDMYEVIGNANLVLSELSIYIDDNPAISVAEIKSKCRRLGNNLGLIVIDYLQLMKSPGSRYDNRATEVAEISRSLKILAKELDVPVLCLSQLSRDSEKRADNRTLLSDLRESGSIEQDADIVMFLSRDYYGTTPDKQNVATLTVAKNRHGETGKIELGWQGQFTKFSARDNVHLEPGQ